MAAMVDEKGFRGVVTAQWQARVVRQGEGKGHGRCKDTAPPVGLPHTPLGVIIPDRRMSVSTFTPLNFAIALEIHYTSWE